MAEIRLLARLGARGERRIEAAAGEPLLEAINRAGLPLGQSCRGEGICRSCAVQVIAGAAALSPPPPIERRARGLDLVGGWRLACQAQVADPAATLVVWHPSWGEPAPPPEGSPGAGPNTPAEPRDTR
ncbi:MAG: (2Fe-2S)-binding protein [Myxococcales bacterium]|nr:(2Fe-2S)-binding protein [Myxococcales bacterium]